MHFHRSSAPATARLGALALATALACALPARAQAPDTPAQAYDLPAQPLGSTLARIASQSGQQISVPADLVRGLQAPAVRGSLSAEQAARAALAGSGLELVRTGSGNWGLRQAALAAAASPAHSTTLPTVTVSGKAEGSTTEGTGSYTTFSTSSSTRLNLTPQETPQAVTVMTRQRMDDQGLFSLNDVLEATAGVTIKPLNVGADGPQIWARGASISNFQIDGVPVSSSMSTYLQGTAMYDRVEIVKGATGIMSGTGTPAATINMIRKRPTATPQASVTVEAGTWSRYGAGLDISRPLNEDASVRGRLVADVKRQGAWTDNYRQDYGTLYGIVEVDLAPRTLLTAGFSHITRNTDSQIRTFPIVYTNGQSTGARPSDGASPDWAFYDHQVDSVFGSVEHRFDSGWSAKAELTRSHYTYDSAMFTLTTVGLNQATGSGAYVLMPRWGADTNQTSLDAYVTGPFSLFGRQHELIGGITLSRLELDSPSYPTTRTNITDIFNWASEVSQPSFPQTGNTSMQENQLGAYLSSRLQLSDATSLLLGSRITDWKRDRESVTYASGSIDTRHNRERNKIVPYAGLVHALNDTYALYASYTGIFKPQDSGVLMYSRTGEMAPEEGKGYEAGIKASFHGGALTSSLSVFRTDQKNLAVWNNAVGFYEAASTAKTEGVEFELAGELVRNWNLSAGYTYNETRDQNDQRILSRIPRNTVKLFTSYRLPGDWNQLTVGGGLHWESKTGDPLSTYTQGSYALVNLMARYDVTKQLAITAHLNNAFDKRYYTALVGPIGIYGPPRNLMLSMKYAF
jgi:outer membrane receptor for ferric coprogen and ferric-rhodotorulic acid